MLFKGAFSGLRQFIATDSPLKMMKDVFYFTSKALFVLKIFKFLIAILSKWQFRTYISLQQYFSYFILIISLTDFIVNTETYINILMIVITKIKRILTKYEA